MVEGAGFATKRVAKDGAFCIDIVALEAGMPRQFFDERAFVSHSVFRFSSLHPGCALSDCGIFKTPVAVYCNAALA